MRATSPVAGVIDGRAKVAATIEVQSKTADVNVDRCERAE